jgi:hypothetical protein
MQRFSTRIRIANSTSSQQGDGVLEEKGMTRMLRKRGFRPRGIEIGTANRMALRAQCSRDHHVNLVGVS